MTELLPPDQPPPQPLFPFEHLDLARTQIDRPGILRINKHRGEALQLDRIVWLNEKFSEGVAVKEIRANEWWWSGHLPGSPLYPAALMIEASAQLASLMFQLKDVPDYEFVGFTALDRTRIFCLPKPGDTLVILGKDVKFHIRRMICDLQGYVGRRIMFEARITGMPFSPRGGPIADAE